MSMGIIISGKGTINGMSVSQGEVVGFLEAALENHRTYDFQVAIRAGAQISIIPEVNTKMELFIGACGRNYSD